MRQVNKHEKQKEQPEVAPCARAETAVRGGHGAANASLNDTGDE